MGNEHSHSPSSYSKQLTPKELHKLEKKVLNEYPFLRSVNESMLVTDNQLPDCPIIFANDSFEKMTLYPQEEIIGFNCRFLQGKHTNPRTVKKIKEAVVDGHSLDVEILNYRKTGQPFLNNFLMLPIHSNPKLPKFATHFIAIQKDVTYICKQKGNVKDWLPIQLALYLEEIGLDEFVMLFIENNINGEMFLKMDHQQLIEMGFSSPSTRIKILEISSMLTSNPNPHSLIPQQENSSLESDSEVLSSQSSSESSEDYSLLSDIEGIVSTQSNETPRQVNHWKTYNPNPSAIKEMNVAIKFFYRGAIEVFIVPRSISLKKLTRRAKKFAKLSRVSLEAETLNASKLLLSSSLQLSSLLSQEMGTLHITVRQKLKKKYNKKRTAIMLPNLTISLQNNLYSLRSILFDQLQTFPSIQFYSSIADAHAFPSAIPTPASSSSPSFSSSNVNFNSFSSLLLSFDCFVCPISFFGDVGENQNFFTFQLLSKFEDYRGIIDELQKTIDEKYEGEMGATNSILIYRSNYYFLFLPFCRSLEEIQLNGDYVYSFMRTLLLKIHKYNRKLSSEEIDSTLANSLSTSSSSSRKRSVKRTTKRSDSTTEISSEIQQIFTMEEDKIVGEIGVKEEEINEIEEAHGKDMQKKISFFEKVSSSRGDKEIENDKKKVKEKKRFLINNVFLPALAIENLFLHSNQQINQNFTHIAQQMSISYSSFSSQQTTAKLRSSFLTSIQPHLSSCSLYYSPFPSLSSSSFASLPPSSSKLSKENSKDMVKDTQIDIEKFTNYISSGALCIRGIGSIDELDLLIQLAHGTNQKYKNDRRLQHMSSTTLLSLFSSRQFHISPYLKIEIAKGIISSSDCLERVMAQSSSSSIHSVVPQIASSEITILNVLTSGASGIIYLVLYDKKKRILKAFHDIGNTLEYFRELTIMSFIDHENLLTVLGSGKLEDGRYFYLTEYYEKGSLFKILQSNNQSNISSLDLPLSPILFNIRSQINVLIDIAKAMSYLHSINFIHRDLKSMNVLINDDDRAVVIDFGTTRKIDSTMTDNVGTVAWMAPEIFTTESYTTKVDVYSYGMIIYEMITRQVPFADKKSFQIAPSVMKGERPTLPLTAPKFLAKLCEKCWHQKPQKRPTFDEILVTLHSFSHP